MPGDIAPDTTPDTTPDATTSSARIEPQGHPGAYEYAGEISMRRDIHDQLVALCRDSLPNEACGLAAGRPGEVARLYPLTNTAASPVRYEVDPLEQLTVYQAMDDDGLSVVAVYHSHPATPARPSVTDIAEAYDPQVAYMILSFAAAEPSVRAFSIRDGTVAELTVSITPQAAEKAADQSKG